MNTQRPIDLARADRELQEAYARRRAMLIAARPDPDYPSTGTEMIAARLAEARAAHRNRRPADIDLRLRPPSPR